VLQQRSSSRLCSSSGSSSSTGTSSSSAAPHAFTTGRKGNARRPRATPVLATGTATDRTDGVVAAEKAAHRRRNRILSYSQALEGGKSNANANVNTSASNGARSPTATVTQVCGERKRTWAQICAGLCMLALLNPMLFVWQGDALEKVDDGTIANGQDRDSADHALRLELTAAATEQENEEHERSSQNRPNGATWTRYFELVVPVDEDNDDGSTEPCTPQAVGGARLPAAPGSTAGGRTPAQVRALLEETLSDRALAKVCA
jgi:hypothetical protein